MPRSKCLNLEENHAYILQLGPAQEESGRPLSPLTTNCSASNERDYEPPPRNGGKGSSCIPLLEQVSGLKEMMEVEAEMLVAVLATMLAPATYRVVRGALKERLAALNSLYPRFIFAMRICRTAPPA